MSETITSTKEEIALLVKMAAREQRYACAGGIRSQCDCDSVILNTPCPYPDKIVALWREECADGEDKS